MVALGPDDEAEREEWLQALASVVDRNAYCLGAEVEALEAEVREQLDVAAAFGVSNGTDALRLSLQAVGVGLQPAGEGARHEVIVPAFSFFASASSVAHLGARPRFVDVSPDTLTLDPAALDSARTSATRAVMPVHLYGQAAAMDEIEPCVRGA